MDVLVSDSSIPISPTSSDDNGANIFQGCLPGYIDDDGNQRPEQHVKRALAEERMNRTIALPGCSCIREPRLVTYAEVGDPEGCVVRP